MPLMVCTVVPRRSTHAWAPDTGARVKPEHVMAKLEAYLLRFCILALVYIAGAQIILCQEALLCAHRPSSAYTSFPLALMQRWCPYIGPCQEGQSAHAQNSQPIPHD